MFLLDPNDPRRSGMAYGNPPILGGVTSNGILNSGGGAYMAPPAQQQGAAQNRRDQSVMSLRPPNTQIGTNEMLIRMGSAGLGQVGMGGNAQMAAIGNAYADAQDLNRQRGLETYNAMVDAQKDATNDKQTAEPTDVYAQAAYDAISEIEGKVAKGGSDYWPFNNVTGFIGSALSYIPGTPAHDVAAQIDTIEAAIGFDRLQAMRDASPTGGALGQVSEMELRLLKSSLGALRQSQSREMFLQNLQRVKTHYENVLNVLERAGTIRSNVVYGNSAAISEADAIVGISQ